MWAYCRSTVRYPRAVDVVFVLLYLTHLLIGIYSTIYVLAGLELLPRIATLIASIEQVLFTYRNTLYTSLCIPELQLCVI